MNPQPPEPQSGALTVELRPPLGLREKDANEHIFLTYKGILVNRIEGKRAEFSVAGRQGGRAEFFVFSPSKR